MKRFLKTILLSVLLSGVVNAQVKSTHYDGKPYVTGEMIIQVAKTGVIRDLMEVAPASFEMKIEKELSAPMRCWLVKFNPQNISHEAFQNWLYKQQGITIADYNYYVQVRSTIPNDASFSQQWHHVNTGQTGGTNDADIDSDLAWDITTGGNTATNDEIVVCMIEGGGGNLNHQDLSPNRWINTGEIPSNGIDDDGNGYVDDYNGWNTGSNNDDTGTGAHGTNCLGMIGAKGNNNLNIVGANWDVKLMVVNMGGSLTQSNVIQAYTYPLELRKMWNNSNGTQGAFVVATSASWGIDGANPANYPLWCQFYDTLGYYGIINVGATTNQNLDVDVSGDMPTACSSPYMVGVGRTDHNDNTAGGYGDQTIELGAPGINVVTTSGSSGITTTTGTSFSCPLTAGVIGLAYSIPCTNFMTLVKNDPKGAADIVLNSLLTGVDVKTQLQSKFVTGGRLNAKNTIDNLMNATCSGNVCLAPSALNATNIGDNTADLTFTAASSATSTTIYWRQVGATNWTEVQNATSPLSLTGLTACTDYEFYGVSICGNTTSNNSSTIQFSTTGCGNCIDLNYCDNKADDAAYEWIEKFDLGAFSNTSGTDGGYGDYTSSQIDVNLGQTYNFTLTPGWANQQYDEYFRIWIDYNQDGTFADSEMVFDQGGENQNVQNGTITIPTTAMTGSTRLRVQMAYIGIGQTSLPNVCGSYTYGETEDYCLNILDNSTSGISKLTNDQVFVYPNPSEDVLNFQLLNNKVQKIELVTLLGQNVSTVSVNDNKKIVISVKGLIPGTYFYRLIGDEGQFLGTGKVIIK